MLKLNLMLKMKINFPVNIVVKHNKPRNVVTEKNRHCERSNFTFTRHNYLKKHQLHCQAKLPKKLDTQNYIKLMRERNFSDICAINRFNRKRFCSPFKHCQNHEENDCCETLFVVLNPSITYYQITIVWIHAMTPAPCFRLSITQLVPALLNRHNGERVIIVSKVKVFCQSFRIFLNC